MMTEQERNFAWKALWRNFGNWRFRVEVSLRVSVTSLPAGQTGLSHWLNGGEPYRPDTWLVDVFLSNQRLPITSPKSCSKTQCLEFRVELKNKNQKTKKTKNKVIKTGKDEP